MATGATNLYNEIGWETLEKRRMNHKMILFYKRYNNLTPDYFSSLVPSSVNEVSRYNLRNANDVQTINARTAPTSIHSYRLLYENGTIYQTMIHMLIQLILLNDS